MVRPARSLRRKTVPARVSCGGGGADAARRREPRWAFAAGEPGWAFASGVGGEDEGRRGSRGAAGLPRLPGGGRASSAPARGRGKEGKLGACQALQVAGSQAGRGS